MTSCSTVAIITERPHARPTVPGAMAIMLDGVRTHVTKLTLPMPTGWWRGRTDHLIREWDSNLLIGLMLLVAVDIGFIAIYSLHDIYISLHHDHVARLSSRWHIGTDRSYAEMFGYLKMASIVVLLLGTYGLSEKRMYSIWAGIFAYVLLDDALLIHERLGRAVAGPSGSTWAYDMGQLVVWILVGIFLLAISIGALVLSSGQNRTNGILLLGTLLALGFFAVLVDLVHVIVQSWFRGADLLFTVIEEGGEQLVLSLAVAVALLIRRSERKKSPLLTS